MAKEPTATDGGVAADKRDEQADLALAERHVREGEARVARLEASLARHPTGPGTELLVEMRNTLRLMKEHRAQLQRARRS